MLIRKIEICSLGFKFEFQILILNINSYTYLFPTKDTKNSPFLLIQIKMRWKCTTKINLLLEKIVLL